jgi:hypothetical protein
MKTYYLKNTPNSSDFISKFQCNDFETACRYFSIIKNLSIRDLLKIYVVVSQ